MEWQSELGFEPRTYRVTERCDETPHRAHTARTALLIDANGG